MTADSAVVVVSAKADGVQATKTPTSNHSDEYVVTFSDVAVAGRRRAGGRAGEAGEPVGARDHRCVRGRAGRRRPAADRRLRRQPRAVRQAAVDVPDRGCAAGRGVHRLAHTDIGGDVGGLAAVRGARRRRRPRCPRLLARVTGTAGDAALPPPARRHGHGHRLPDGPLLLDDQGPDPAAGRPVTASESSWGLDMVGA